MKGSSNQSIGDVITRDDLLDIALGWAYAPPSRERRLKKGDMLKLSSEFKIKDFLSQGGQGTVYRATQTSLAREVVLKTANVGLNAKEAKALHHEAQVAATAAESISSGRIVPVYALEHDENANRWYYISMYIKGGQSLLKAAWRHGEAGFIKGIGWLRDVAMDVQVMHNEGIRHFDLKPSNILVKEGRPLILDFGLSKLFEHRFDGRRFVGGTDGYAAPEQWEGDKVPDEKADVFAMGAILYALLTGKDPETDLSKLDAIALPIASLNALEANKFDSNDIVAICRKCLYHNPKDRYISAQALADDLTLWLNHRPPSFRPIGRLRKRIYKANDWIKAIPRWTKFVAVGIGVFALIVTFLLWRGHQQQSALKLEKQAHEAERRALQLAAYMSHPDYAHLPIVTRLERWAEINLQKDFHSAELNEVKRSLVASLDDAGSPFARNIAISLYYDNLISTIDQKSNADKSKGLPYWADNSLLATLVSQDEQSELISGRQALAIGWLDRTGMLVWFNLLDPKDKQLTFDENGWKNLSAFYASFNESQDISKYATAEVYAALSAAHPIAPAESRTTPTIERSALVRDIVLAMMRARLNCVSPVWDGMSLVTHDPQNGVLAGMAASLCGLSKEQRWAHVERMAVATKWNDPSVMLYEPMVNALKNGISLPTSDATPAAALFREQRQAVIRNLKVAFAGNGWRPGPLQGTVQDEDLFQGLALWFMPDLGRFPDYPNMWTTLCNERKEEAEARVTCLRAVKAILDHPQVPTWLVFDALQVAVAIDSTSRLSNGARALLARRHFAAEAWTDLRWDLLYDPGNIDVFLQTVYDNGFLTVVDGEMSKRRKPLPVRYSQEALNECDLVVWEHLRDCLADAVR